jgi:hypothetical protein
MAESNDNNTTLNPSVVIKPGQVTYRALLDCIDLYDESRDDEDTYSVMFDTDERGSCEATTIQAVRSTGPCPSDSPKPKQTSRNV